mgnify:CR=1 FL=1
MIVPEYLRLFSGQGDISVIVKLKNHDGTIAERRMIAEEIKSLLSSDGASFHQLMTFDDYLFSVYKYEIDVIRKKLTIFASASDLVNY